MGETARVLAARSVGVFAPQRRGLPACLDVARAAEVRGLAGVWFGEPGFIADPLVTAAAGAAVTTTVPVGVAMVNIWRMLPAALASAVRSIADVAPNRLRVTLGPWHQVDAIRAGAGRRDPVQAMVEMTRIVSDLLAGRSVTHDGPVFRLDGVELGREPVQVPLLWGVMGPKMVAAAGAHADGVTLNYAASTDRVHDVITAARVAADHTGRDPDALRFPVHVLTTVDDDGDAAVERFRAQLEAWPVLRAESGLPDGPVSTEAAAGRSASGTPAHVRQRLRAYLEAGATEVIVVSGDPLTALDAILDIR